MRQTTRELYKLQPTYILHGGYRSSVGEVLAPTGGMMTRCFRRRWSGGSCITWLPDIYMDPHGYPTHEWVHQFAGYKVPWVMAFWIPRGYHINLHLIDDPELPQSQGSWLGAA